MHMMMLLVNTHNSLSLLKLSSLFLLFLFVIVSPILLFFIVASGWPLLLLFGFLILFIEAPSLSLGLLFSIPPLILLLLSGKVFHLPAFLDVMI